MRSIPFWRRPNRSDTLGDDISPPSGRLRLTSPLTRPLARRAEAPPPAIGGARAGPLGRLPFQGAGSILLCFLSPFTPHLPPQTPRARFFCCQPPFFLRGGPKKEPRRLRASALARVSLADSHLSPEPFRAFFSRRAGSLSPRPRGRTCLPSTASSRRADGRRLFLSRE